MMIKYGEGHVVFISSYAAEHPTVGQTAYATAKAAILGLTRDLALRHGSNSIRVNAILPGFMETPMTENVSAKRKHEVRESHVLGEFNIPDVVAEFILFLEGKWYRYKSITLKKSKMFHFLKINKLIVNRLNEFCPVIVLLFF